MFPAECQRCLLFKYFFCVFQSLVIQQQKVSDLMEMCLQKDEIISKLQATMDATVEDANRDVNTQ